MRSVFYLRVSTKEQDYNNQLKPLQDFAAARSWENVRIYTEKESAWKQGQQGELDALKADARMRKFDVLLVWALDRLTRQGPAAILNMVADFHQYGVKIVSYRESWTETLDEHYLPLFLSIQGWIAEQESIRRSERIRAAAERTKTTGRTSKGKKWGRPKGKKDSPGVRRKRSNYVRRWENERELNNLPSPTTNEKTDEKPD
jgi:putative DNA-invertase from lambdoid prophage Rac